MINQDKKRQALGAVLGAWNSYGNKPFKVLPNSKNRAPLKWAEAMDWVWWPEDDRCAITAAGFAALAPYRLKEPA